MGKSFAKSERKAKLRALMFALPLLLFLSLNFIFPILRMLWLGAYDPLVGKTLPRTISALEKEWKDKSVPPNEEVFSALVFDLKLAYKERISGRLATRLNYERGGLRSLVQGTARRLRRIKGPPYKEAVIGLNSQWGELEIWNTILRLSPPVTAVQYLAALDLRYDQNGAIVKVPKEVRLFVSLYGRTLWMSFLVMIYCLLLAYPLAYLLANVSQGLGGVLMIGVLLPFWTSLLVRTTAWIVILQTSGVVNDFLVYLGFIDNLARPQLMYNRTGTMIAMTHILLPFMVLPIYSVMKTISPTYMRAAQSLGAQRFYAFWKVYVPQTLPGVGAGSLLVFILAIGYYITPALLGGTDGIMISNLIAYHMQTSLNWGLAAALSGILLAIILVLYWFFNRVVGLDKLNQG